MEEIDEVPEALGAIVFDDVGSPTTLEENMSADESHNASLSLESRDMKQVNDAATTEDKKELVLVKSEPLPNTFQTILKEMKRQLIEARSQIAYLYQNHRTTIIEKLRLYVAAVLVGLAACFLLWMMFPSAEAWQRAQSYTLDKLLRPSLDKPPAT